MIDIKFDEDVFEQNFTARNPTAGTKVVLVVRGGRIPNALNKKIFEGLEKVLKDVQKVGVGKKKEE